MIKVLVVFIVIIVVKVGINLSNLLYLRITLGLINDDFETTKRMIHTRRLCSKAGLNCHRYFDDPMFNKKELRGIICMAYGEYEHRCKEALNPFYWIKTIIFLPQSLIKYFGGNSDNLISKIFVFIFWLITGYTTIFIPELRNYILAFFK